MSENDRNTGKSPSWDDVLDFVAHTAKNETLATEVIKTEREKSKAKDVGLICVAVVASVAIACFAVVNYRQSQTIERNNRGWIEYLSQYDFVSQDGEGYNYYNSDVGGDVSNGAAGQEKER